MITALPKQPTIGSILTGIALFVIAFLAFLRLPDFVKYAGAALLYVPSKLGLVDMVTPQDVIPLSLDKNPSSLTIPSPGQYLLYLDNYDLLIIHDGIVARNNDPWIKIQSEDRDTKIEITLLERGLAWYDTPFAPGRPVALFKIDRPGTYWVVHPTRLDIAGVVPDTITGKESLLTFWALAEIAVIGGAVFYLVRKRTAPTRQLRLNLRAQNRARVEDSWKRIKERTMDKRQEEDLPHWKKR
jgi:hypothetical protein